MGRTVGLWIFGILFTLGIGLEASPWKILIDGDFRGRLETQASSLAHSMGMIQELRGQFPELLLLSTGSNLGPSPASEVDGGRRFLDWMHRAGYQGMALGRKDLFAGVENLRAQLERSRFEILASNLSGLELKSNQDRLRTHGLFQRPGSSLLVLSFLTKDAVGYGSRWDPRLKLEEVRTSLLRELARVPDSVLGSMSFREASQILREFPRVDAVICNRIGVDDFLGPDSFEYRLRDGRGIFWTETLGESSLLLTLVPRSTGPSWLKVESKARIDFPPLPWVQEEFLDPSRQAIDRELSGSLLVLSESEKARFRPTLVDVLRVALDCEVGILHKGSFEGGRVPSRVSRKDLREIYPFTDHGARLELSGRELERLYRSRGRSMDPKRHLVFSGIEEVGGKLLIRGRRLDPKDLYRVASVDFLTLGGFGPVLSKKGEVDPRRTIEIFEEFFQRPSWRRDLERDPARRLVRQKLSLDFSRSRTAFGGSASQFQYVENRAIGLGSEIPGLVGLGTRSLEVGLNHELILDRIDSDLSFQLDLGYKEFNPAGTDLKTLDRAQASVRWVEKEPRRTGPTRYASLDVHSTLRDPNRAGSDRPLFVRANLGYEWKLPELGRLYLGLGRMARFATPGDPQATGANLGYSLARDLFGGRLGAAPWMASSVRTRRRFASSTGRTSFAGS